MDWGKESSDDIDLWMRQPDGKIVYFGKKDRGGANLERDDLGTVNDCFYVKGERKCIYVNREVIMIRGLQEGEYQVKFVVYSPRIDRDGNPVTVEIIDINPYKIEFSKEFIYTTPKQTISVIRFTVNADGNIESFSEVPADFDINRSQRPAGSSAGPDPSYAQNQ